MPETAFCTPAKCDWLSLLSKWLWWEILLVYILFVVPSISHLTLTESLHPLIPFPEHLNAIIFFVGYILCNKVGSIAIMGRCTGPSFKLFHGWHSVEFKSRWLAQSSLFDSVQRMCKITNCISAFIESQKNICRSFIILQLKCPTSIREDLVVTLCYINNSPLDS